MWYMVTMDVCGESVEEAFSKIKFPRDFEGEIGPTYVDDLGDKQYRVYIPIKAESEEYIRKNLTQVMTVMMVLDL